VGHRRGPHDCLRAALAATAEIIQRMPCHLIKKRVRLGVASSRSAVVSVCRYCVVALCSCTVIGRLMCDAALPPDGVAPL
jgi:hypothetical protein